MSLRCRLGIHDGDPCGRCGRELPVPGVRPVGPPPPMPDPPVKYIERDLQRVTLKDGDRIVISCRQRLRASEEKGLLDAVSSAFPGVRGIILQDGMRLGVVSREHDDAEPNADDVPNETQTESGSVE